MRHASRSTSFLLLGVLASIPSVGCVDVDDVDDMDDMDDDGGSDPDSGFEPSGNGLDVAVDPGNDGPLIGPADQQPAQTTTPDAQFFVRTAGARADEVDLWFESSELTVERLGNTTYVSWFATVKNRGAEPLCETFAVARLNNGDDDPIVGRPEGFGTLVTLRGYVDAAAHKLGDLPFSVPCVAPGERGVLYAVAETGREFARAEIENFKIVLNTRMTSDAAPHGVAPTLVSSLLERVEGPTHVRSATGEIRNDSASTVTNLDFAFYPLGSNFSVHGMLTAHIDELAPGASWQFATDAVAMPNANDINGYASFDTKNDPDRERTDDERRLHQRHADHIDWKSRRDELATLRDKAREEAGHN